MTTTTSTTTTSPATRLVDGVELPAAGRWVLDPGHTEVGFVGRHLLLTKVRGRFTAVEGVIEVADDPTASTVEVVIDVASVASGDDSRDAHLRSADLFDVERFPTARFRSTSVAWRGTTGTVDGVLELKGASRPVRLDVELLGEVRDPWGGDRAVFTASARIDRTDWGISWNLPLEAGGVLVSKEIDLRLEVEAVREAGTA
jgi:polyisoprenoid-binding protein YceI